MLSFVPLGSLASAGLSMLGRAFRVATTAVVAPVTGFFWAPTYQASNPSTVTTKFDDGVSGDQTTFEELTGGVGATIGITASRVYASAQALNSISGKIWFTDNVTIVVERWTGSAWSTDFNSGIMPGIVSLGGGEWASFTQNLNPALTAIKFRVSVQTIGSGIASNVKIADIRTT